MILNVFKPKNWTSFDVVAKLRGKLKTKKIGHTGSLDPLAEGVLVVVTENDTKKQETLMKDTKKEYIAEIALGAETESYDLEFIPTISKLFLSADAIKAKLPKIMFRFMGEIEQIAPAYSAKKVGGKTLYKEARKGTLDPEILPKSLVSIYEFVVLDLFSKKIMTDEGEKELPVLKCRIVCSSGTYIRSIAHDLGVVLGTGGVLVSLVRTKVGNHELKDSVKLEDL